MGIKKDTRVDIGEEEVGERRSYYLREWIKYLQVLKKIPIFVQTDSTMVKHEIRTLPGENLIGEIFARFPELNVRQVARSMGINETLMQQYINGVKRPSFDRAMEIEDFLHKLGRELLEVKIDSSQQSYWR